MHCNGIVDQQFSASSFTGLVAPVWSAKLLPDQYFQYAENIFTLPVTSWGKYGSALKKMRIKKKAASL